MNRTCNRRASAGFTLVELMISMVLGLLLGAAVLSIFLYSRHSFDGDEMVVRMQDDARQAVRELASDLGMAGFYADLLLPSAIVQDDSLDVGTDCGDPGVMNAIYQTVNGADSLSLTVVDNASGASAAAAFSCIDAGELVAGTDVVATKRVAGATTAVPVANRVYLRTNGTVGLLHVEPAPTPAVAVPVPFAEWEYRPSIYFVRNYAVVAGDGIPTLCRKVLQYDSPPTVVTECLAQGIENLQVEFGLDDDGDGEPNYYASDPTLGELQTAVSARISVLARSADRDLQYTNDKTYRIGNAPDFTPADNYYRRVFTVTVNIPNQQSLRLIGS
jgi:type IV pilus assembly protein PilW